MPKKPAAKPTRKPVNKTAKKPASKSAPAPSRTSPWTKIDKSMAVVLQATGLEQLKPIRPVRKKAVRSKDEPTPR